MLQHWIYISYQCVKNFEGTKTKSELLHWEFLVKIQAGRDTDPVNGSGLACKLEDSEIHIYDRSRTVCGSVNHEFLFNFVRQFGKLCSEMNYSTRIYLNARMIEKNVDHIQVRTDILPLDQGW